jgi:hypothetical protein
MMPGVALGKTAKVDYPRKINLLVVDSHGLDVLIRTTPIMAKN